MTLRSLAVLHAADSIPMMQNLCSQGFFWAWWGSLHNQCRALVFRSFCIESGWSFPKQNQILVGYYQLYILIK